MISTKEFIHEQDAALTRKIFAETPFKSLMDKLHENNFDAVCDYVCSASFVEIQQPDLIKMREIACQKFNIKNFLMCSTRDYNFEISTFGYNSPAILIPNSLIQSADENILQARIYASAAAVAAGQQKLTFFIWAAENMSGISNLPVIGQALSALLYEWNRVRQFSLDRAVFLATGDINLSLKNILFGVVPNDLLDNFNFGTDADTFLVQMNRYFKYDNPLEIISKAFGYLSDYSWLPRRYEELRKFYRSGGEL